MAGIVLPTAAGTPSFRQRTVLDGREYALAFRWSERSSRWFVDIADASESSLASGIKLVANFPLLESRRFAPGLPPGELFVVDARATPADPGLDELGTVVELVYITSAEIAAAEAGT